MGKRGTKIVNYRTDRWFWRQMESRFPIFQSIWQKLFVALSPAETDEVSINNDREQMKSITRSFASGYIAETQAGNFISATFIHSRRDASLKERFPNSSGIFKLQR